MIQNFFNFCFLLQKSNKENVTSYDKSNAVYFWFRRKFWTDQTMASRIKSTAKPAKPKMQIQPHTYDHTPQPHTALTLHGRIDIQIQAVLRLVLQVRKHAAQKLQPSAGHLLQGGRLVGDVGQPLRAHRSVAVRNIQSRNVNMYCWKSHYAHSPTKCD